MPTDTPWGPASETTICAPGIRRYGTAAHGGYHLDDQRNALVHEAWRRPDGWYEDNDAAIVHLSFLDVFPRKADVMKYVRHAAHEDFPDAYEQIFGPYEPATDILELDW